MALSYVYHQRIISSEKELHSPLCYPGNGLCLINLSSPTCLRNTIHFSIGKIGPWLISIIRIYPHSCWVCISWVSAMTRWWMRLSGTERRSISTGQSFSFHLSVLKIYQLTAGSPRNVAQRSWATTKCSKKENWEMPMKNISTVEEVRVSQYSPDSATS